MDARGLNPDVLSPDWRTPENARHNVRVLCDRAGLSLHEKEIITACIKQESGFDPYAIGKVNANGTQDFGICQFNNGVNKRGQAYWIGTGAAFPSIKYVLDHPQECVEEMIRQFQAGNIGKWSSYSTGAYLRHLPK